MKEQESWQMGDAKELGWTINMTQDTATWSIAIKRMQRALIGFTKCGLKMMNKVAQNAVFYTSCTKFVWITFITEYSFFHTSCTELVWITFIHQMSGSKNEKQKENNTVRFGSQASPNKLSKQQIHIHL